MAERHPNPGPGQDIQEYSVDQLKERRAQAGRPEQMDREIERRARLWDQHHGKGGK